MVWSFEPLPVPRILLQFRGVAANLFSGLIGRALGLKCAYFLKSKWKKKSLELQHSLLFQSASSLSGGDRRETGTDKILPVPVLCPNRQDACSTGNANFGEIPRC